MTSRDEFASSVAAAIETGKPGNKILILAGGPGWGKTTLLRSIERRLSRKNLLIPLFLSLEETCFSPEFLLEKTTGLLKEILDDSRKHRRSEADSDKAAVPRWFELVDEVGGITGKPQAILIDEAAELAVLKSFPGQGDPLVDFLDGCRGRAVVMTTAFPARLLKAASIAGVDIQVMEIPPISTTDVLDLAGGIAVSISEMDARTLTHAVGGSPSYAHSMLRIWKSGEFGGIRDLIEAGLERGSTLELLCRFNYEYLVQKSRGQGIVRQLLAVLAGFDAEPGRANLTSLAGVLGRSLGVTKDYLKWLLDVSLIECEDKRYWVKDRLLASWIRIYRSGEPFNKDGIAVEAELLVRGAEESGAVAPSRSVKRAIKAPASRKKTRESEVPSDSRGEERGGYIIHRPKPGDGLMELD
jgi:hypothetical protein